jgi:hypothetical protein
MKRVSLIVTFVLVLSAAPILPSVQADVPTGLAYTATPKAFPLGGAAVTNVCMVQQTNPPGNFDPGDVAAIVFDPSLGTVTGVDNPVTVNSATLSGGDFTASQSGGNPNKVLITYTAGSSKLFGFGNSICAKVHFTANASAAAALVRFSNKFTGTTGTLPSIALSIVDPSLLPLATLGSTTLLPGGSPGSIAVDRSTGTNPGSTFSIRGGSPAAGATDIAGGDLFLGAGPGTGLGGGGNVRIQTAGANDLSGTTDNLLVDREIFVSKAKQLTLSAPGFTSLMSIHLLGTHTAGGRIFYMVRATDGGSQIATEEGVIQYLATANSITCTVQTTDKLHLGTVNSGCTPGFFNPGSQPGVSIFDNVTFSSPAPIVVHEVYFRIENDSGSSIRLEP